MERFLQAKIEECENNDNITTFVRITSKPERRKGDIAIEPVANNVTTEEQRGRFGPGKGRTQSK